MSSTDTRGRRAPAAARRTPSAALAARRTPSAALVARALAVAAASPLLLAIAQVPGPIEVGPNWATADDANHSGSLFTRMVNHGTLADRLMAARCPAFGSVGFAGLDPATQGDRGAEQGVLLPAGGTVTLSPSGPHLVATDARRPLPQGMLLSCTLRFAHSGERIVVFSVGPEGQVMDEP